jgi:hypothetical protein
MSSHHDDDCTMFEASFRLEHKLAGFLSDYAVDSYRNPVPWVPPSILSTHQPPASITFTSISSGKRFFNPLLPSLTSFPTVFHSHRNVSSHNHGNLLLFCPTPIPTAASHASSSIEIEAWTISALQSLKISHFARVTGATLSIPLDSDGTPPSSLL